ncbi:MULTISPECIES: hypothetical protein [unclassified Haloferax]|uniref:DUF7124 domain-containing protein n=1 Tax=unclassified Haloferax TaxID=2625095 RepID=UPI0002B098F2|nr:MULTISPECIES: hypothetical protein [unclassified Haloferax]ELZ59610.1 hypothetical protein C460_07188 [Haloferax sp. ATCC BAA-646]ELZ72190.1 hypothetical protein C458_00700 [Haloferax sp. ATCC BAA-644]
MADEHMTLAFELAALRRARDPQAVVTDARRWAQYVGLLSTNPEAAHAFSATHLVRRDFQLRPTASSFRELSSRVETERYVLVGTASNRPAYLPSQRWEYLRLEAAATAAGWELENPNTTRRERWSAWLSGLLRVPE